MKIFNRNPFSLISVLAFPVGFVFIVFLTIITGSPYVGVNVLFLVPLTFLAGLIGMWQERQKSKLDFFLALIGITLHVLLFVVYPTLQFKQSYDELNLLYSRDINKDFPIENLIISPNERVIIKNKSGTFSILATDTFERLYQIEGEEDIKCKRLFIVDPVIDFVSNLYIVRGSSSFKNDCRSYPSGTIYYEEITRNFKNINYFKDFVEFEEGGYYKNDVIYNNDGLLASYRISEENDIFLYMYQILIENKVPNQLPGADDNAIKKLPLN